MVEGTSATRGGSPRPQDGGPGERAHRNALRDANEHLEVELPTAGRIFRLLGRAFMLRCPHCGKGPVRRGWFHILPACGHCHLLLERGEPDYFLGAMLFNLVLAELLFVGIFVTVLIVMWPTVPWDGIQIGAPIGMAVAPFVLYPVSKLTWLAFDLSFRPEPGS
ncbi:MAG: hypothetical protein ABIZ91_07025 [Gemmatimonadaceae bacterium]